MTFVLRRRFKMDIFRLRRPLTATAPRATVRVGVQMRNLWHAHAGAEVSAEPWRRQRRHWRP